VQTLRRLLIALTVLFVGLLAAVAVNQTPVTLRFLLWQTPEWSVFWWLLIAFALGVLLGYSLALFRTIPVRLQQRQLRKTLAASQTEVERLKTSGLPPA